MSWTDLVDVVGSLLSRRAKTVVGVAFALLVVFVPPARAVIVDIGMAIIHDTQRRITRDLAPLMPQLVTPAANDRLNAP